MKRIIFSVLSGTILVMCFIFILNVANGQGGNLLLNGTFNGITYWYDIGAVYTTEVDYAGGDGSLEFANDTLEAWHDPVTVTVSGEYVRSMMVYVPPECPSESVGFLTCFNDCASQVNSGSGWQSYVYTNTLEAGLGPYDFWIRRYVIPEPECNVSVFVDDVQIVLQEPPITPSPTVTSVLSIPLSSGNQFTVNYSWSFGEMAISAMLAIIIVVFCARWMYDVVIQLWSMRGDNDSL